MNKDDSLSRGLRLGDDGVEENEDAEPERAPPTEVPLAMPEHLQYDENLYVAFFFTCVEDTTGLNVSFFLFLPVQKAFVSISGQFKHSTHPHK